MTADQLRWLSQLGYPDDAQVFCPRSEREHDQQVALFQMLDAYVYRGRKLGDLAFAVPNAGARSARNGARMKAEGLRPGVPDIFIEIPVGIYHGLRIEMKRENAVPSDISAAQRLWCDKLNAQGYCTVFARGCKDAWRIISAYLSGTEFETFEGKKPWKNTMKSSG